MLGICCHLRFGWIADLVVLAWTFDWVGNLAGLDIAVVLMFGWGWDGDLVGLGDYVGFGDLAVLVMLEILLVYRFSCAGLGWYGDIKFVWVGDMVVLG